MHPVKFLSRGRGGGLWWPAGLFVSLLLCLLLTKLQTEDIATLMTAICIILYISSIKLEIK